MMSDRWIWRVHKADGSVTTERRYADGRVETIDGVRHVEVVAGEGGYWQRSTANGVMPHKGAIRRAMKMDQKVGAPSIDYDKKGRACFTSAAEKRQWLKAHRRVDHDAGYRDPVPGDFQSQFPGEFD